MPIRIVVERIIPAARETVFHTVPDTTSNWKVFFAGFKPFVGAITDAYIEDDGPVVPGARRHVSFSDDTRIVEQIVDHDFPRLHHYQVTEPTKLQRATMSLIDSRWELIAVDERTCRVRWTYSLTPRSALDYPVVRTVGAFGFRGAMRACLDTIQAYFIEREEGDAGANRRAARVDEIVDRRTRNLRKAALVAGVSIAGLALLSRQRRRRRRAASAPPARGRRQAPGEDGTTSPAADARPGTT